MDIQGYRALRLRIAGAIVAFSLIPLCVLGSFIYSRFSTTYAEKIEGGLRIIVGNKHTAIDMFLEERIAQLRTLAHTHDIERLGDVAFLRRVFDVVQAGSKSFIDLGVIDQDGNHVAYVGPYDLGDVNYCGAAWFNEAMLRGVHVSNVFMGFRNFPHFIIAVTCRRNDRLWILRATIDSEVFDSLVRSVQLGKGGDAFLVGADGLLQTTARFNGPVLTPVAAPVDQRFSGERIQTLNLGGHEVLAGMAWLDHTGWLLVVTEDPGEAMSPLLRTQSIVLVLILAGLAVIVTGALLVTRATTAKLIRSDQEKAALDASLVQSGKMAALGKLAAGIAHEVNNPLTLIRESAGWIKDLLTDEDHDKMVNYDEISEVVDKIEAHVDRAKAVTHRMLGFARRMEPVHEKVDLGGLAEQTIAFLETEANFRGIEIVRHMDRDLPVIHSDTAQIQQVFLNILENAIDAVDRDGKIVVSSGRDKKPDMVFLSIEDTGPGIPPDIRGKLFDPFMTTKPPGEGTGLGLSIAYSIVGKLGGTIDVESEPGSGARFTVRLPVGSA